MRVGLVLGGGGAVGLAYHAGALAALEHELQWDPRDADVIVGTSAGSIMATLLRRGLSAGDLAAVAVESRPLSMSLDVEAVLRARPAFEAPAIHRWLLRRPRWPKPSVFARLVARPWTFDLSHALASVLPDGPLDITATGTDFANLFGAEWPDRDLELCVVRQGDLRRVVFGREARPPVWQAVAASCAIPSFFSPIEIDGDRYFDGGVRSPTNADIVARRPLDLVIVVSPMSARRAPGFGYRDVMRRHAGARLARERSVLERNGLPSFVVTPGASVTRLSGLNLMSEANVHDIVRATYFDTADLLSTFASRSTLRPLTERTRRRAATSSDREAS
jgi:NTE family protein